VILLVVALVGLGAPVSCTASGGSPRLREEIESRALHSDPSQPAFERYLTGEGGLMDGLLAVDQWVFPGLDIVPAKAAFAELCLETDRELCRRLGSGEREPRDGDAASAFLATLARRKFQYEDALTSRGGRPDSKVIAYTLLEKRGCCGTFTLLCMAYLDQKGIRSSLVCLPDHCVVRLGEGSSALDVEATDFRTPLRRASGDPGLERPFPSGTHYGAPLDPARALWHYYSDRLWGWIPWRSTDAYALRSLRRAREAIGSTCQSIEAHEARRYFLMAKDPESPQESRHQAWRESVALFRKLKGWHPEDPDYRQALAELQTFGVERLRETSVLADVPEAPDGGDD